MRRRDEKKRATSPRQILSEVLCTEVTNKPGGKLHDGFAGGPNPRDPSLPRQPWQGGGQQEGGKARERERGRGKEEGGREADFARPVGSLTQILKRQCPTTFTA